MRDKTSDAASRANLLPRSRLALGRLPHPIEERLYYGVLATEAAQRLWRSGSYPSETLLSL
jgi:hypothetical protein